jgi:hypothetical protein
LYLIDHESFHNIALALGNKSEPSSWQRNGNIVLQRTVKPSDNIAAHAWKLVELKAVETAMSIFSL